MSGSYELASVSGLRRSAAVLVLATLCAWPEAATAQSEDENASFDCARIGHLWENASKEDLRDAKLHFRSTKLYFSQELFARAAREAELAIHLDPKEPEYRMRAAMAYGKLDCDEATGKAFAEALQAASADPKRYEKLIQEIENNRSFFFVDRFNRGIEASDKGEFGVAVELLRRAIAIDERDTRGYRNLGVVLAQLGDNEAALEAFEKALVQEPDNVQTRSSCRVARAAVANDRFKEGQRLAATDSVDAGVGKYKEAVRLLEDAIQMDATDEDRADFFRNLAVIHQEIGDTDTIPERKNEAFSQAISSFRTAAQARHRVAAASGQPPLTLDTDEQYLRDVIGSFISMQAYDSTLVYGQRLIDLDPSKGGGYGLVARAMQQMGDRDRALVNYVMLQCLDPKDGHVVEDIDAHIVELLNRYQRTDQIVEDAVTNLENPEAIRTATREKDVSEAWIYWQKGRANCYYNGQRIGTVEFKPVLPSSPAGS